MPKPFPKEFRDDVVRVARNRDSETTIEQVAKDFGIHATTLGSWMRRADVEDGVKPGVTDAESAELRELKRRNRLLEQETRCCAAQRRICLRRICRENDVPARPRTRR